MKTPIAAALAALLLSIPALAQEGSDLSPPPPPPPPSVEAPRIAAPVNEPPAAATQARIDSSRSRFGIGAYAALANSHIQSVGLLGLSIQFGVQINDDYAVYALLQGSTIVAMSIGNASLMVEREFLGRLSVAVGVGTAAQHNLCISFSGSCADYGSTSVNVPVRVALNLGSVDPVKTGRNRFSIALDVAAGAITSTSGEGRDPAGGRLALYGGVSVGYTAM